jgi:intracellular multiplication protein IcmB
MGFGKSAELASDNYSLLLHPDTDELAFIRQIDIGTTSRGFIRMVRGLLPSNKAYLAQYHRIQNTVEYRYNILDTLPLLRKPTAVQLSTVRDILVTLSIPDDKRLPEDGTYQAVRSLINLGYKRTQDRRYAIRYKKHLCPMVDEELERLNFKPTRKIVLWWDIADFLFIHKSEYQQVAQQQAVPDLPYLVSLTSDEGLQSEFEDVVTSKGEPILKFIARKLSAAMDDFPILSGRTRWNLSGARIVSLDLDDVTRGKGPAAHKQNTVFYNLATNILTHDIFMYEEQLKEIPTEVGIFDINSREHFQKEIRRLRRIPKRFCVDELHRGGGIETFESMLETTVFEGRKGGIDIVLATQLVKSVQNSIVELANTITILGAGNASNVQACVEKFKLDPSLKYILENEMRSPNASGATSLNIFKTKRGTVQHKLVSTVGPGFLWRINSIQEDSYVRERLSQVVGEDVAHEILVKRYPSGTIEHEIERLRKNRGIMSDEIEESILDELVEDNIRYFNTQFVKA